MARSSTTWTKGKAPEGAGRPKKDREVRYLEIAKSSIPFHRWKNVIVKALEQAEQGDKDARKFLADYLMGKPTDKLEITERNKIGEISDEEFLELEMRLGRGLGSDSVSATGEGEEEV